MAKEILPVDFKDDIMNETMEGRRRYRIIQNSDGTVSFEDATEYDQLGSEFGQGQINKTNQAVNESLDKGRVIDSLEEIAINSEIGYVMGALAGKKINQNVSDLNSDLGGCTFDVKEDGAYIIYTPPGGADPVSKKLGKVTPTKLFSNVGDGNYNCTTIENYNQLTKDDFLVEISSWNSSGGARRTTDASYPQFGEITNSGNLSKSYNATTGILSLGGISGSRNSDTSGWVHFTWFAAKVNIYVII